MRIYIFALKYAYVLEKKDLSLVEKFMALDDSTLLRLWMIIFLKIGDSKMSMTMGKNKL
ncbi:hypothetical protein [Scytonema hofmannii]|uniref:hypothetical protein n=1 Tax=Scytonema hofmannii TaxID=34078 RepID=UPI00034CEF5B|nr:hypothetical protein [Scytonema hofmannii]